MRNHWVLARVRGIEIGFHSSWLILAALMVSSLAGYFSSAAPGWDRALVWGSAAVTALAVFASLVLHELAHAAVARSRGIPVSAITLFALGGVARIEAEAADPMTELWMGLAGPAASLAIGLAAWQGASWLSNGLERPEPLPAALALVAAANLAIAVFNLLPAYPLDGGRVLRAVLWQRSGDVLAATCTAARGGQAVAGGLMVLGAVRVIGGGGFAGLWPALVGWFLLEAATAAHVQAELKRLLAGVRVDQLMGRPAAVDAEELLGDFVDLRMFPDGRAFAVLKGEAVIGLIGPAEAARVPRQLRRFRTVGDAMRPLESADCLAPDTRASDALERMARGGYQDLPVVGPEGLAGVVSRSRLLGALEARRLL